jgi:TRAP-type C4-dicarboxylate transport system permease small subunit
MTIDPDRPPKVSDPKSSSRLGLMLLVIHRVEDLIIAVMLTATMGLALYQIVLRNIMGTGIIWGDILVRLMVLWLGMAGAMAATRQQKHISVDLITRFLSPAWHRVSQGLTTFFAGSVCLVAFYYCLQFVISEYEAGDLAFAQVPYWACESILPLAFFIIALRYFILFLLTLIGGLKATS